MLDVVHGVLKRLATIKRILFDEVFLLLSIRALKSENRRFERIFQNNFKII